MLAENEHRLDFAPSERQAIAKAIEEEIGNRQGQRCDTELQSNCAEVPKGKQTRDIAAEKASFANSTEYARVSKVVEYGAPRA